MKLLPCIVFVNSQLYEMLDDVQAWGRASVLTVLKYFNYIIVS